MKKYGNNKKVVLRRKFEKGEFYKEYHTLWDDLSRPGNLVATDKSYFINLSFDNGYDIYVSFRDKDTSKIIVSLGFLDEKQGYIHDIDTRLVKNASEVKDVIYNFFITTQKLISYDYNNYEAMKKYKAKNDLTTFIR